MARVRRVGAGGAAVGRPRCAASGGVEATRRRESEPPASGERRGSERDAGRRARGSRRNAANARAPRTSTTPAASHRAPRFCAADPRASPDRVQQPAHRRMP